MKLNNNKIDDDEYKKHIFFILKKHLNIDDDAINNFMANDKIKNKIAKINDIEKQILKEYRLQHFAQLALSLPNATVGVNYEFIIDAEILKENNIESYYWSQLEDIGLQFCESTKKLIGKPIKDGNFTIELQFSLHGENQQYCHKKAINIIINPDPKSLWKNIPTDEKAPFQKLDDFSSCGKLGLKNFVAVSKRGRAHCNNGSFRDDDYNFYYCEDSAWSVAVIADGAGSAKLSRQGAKVSCDCVIEFLKNKQQKTQLLQLDEKIKEYADNRDDSLLNSIDIESKKTLYNVTINVYNQLIELAKDSQLKYPNIFNDDKRIATDYFHTTLSFVFFKYFENLGYVLLTFGVGDCPIVLVNQENIKLLNKLDIGEYGGGTRFITENKIFQSPNMANRFSMFIAKDLQFLFLMTDGIYDAKFEVEANLQNPQKWQLFIEDLKGNNEDNIAINFDDNPNVVVDELNNWMDFWSKGNHDDRTLFIIY